MHKTQTHYIQIFQLSYKNDTMSTPLSKLLSGCWIPQWRQAEGCRCSLPISMRPQTFIWTTEEHWLLKWNPKFLASSPIHCLFRLVHTHLYKNTIQHTTSLHSPPRGAILLYLHRLYCYIAYQDLYSKKGTAVWEFAWEMKYQWNKMQTNSQAARHTGTLLNISKKWTGSSSPGASGSIIPWMPQDNEACVWLWAH